MIANLLTLGLCACVCVCVQATSWGFGRTNGSIIMACLQNRKMKLKSLRDLIPLPDLQRTTGLLLIIPSVIIVIFSHRIEFSVIMSDSHSQRLLVPWSYLQ